MPRHNKPKDIALELPVSTLVQLKEIQMDLELKSLSDTLVFLINMSHNIMVEHNIDEALNNGQDQEVGECCRSPSDKDSTDGSLH